jgi:hypothetical protein
MFYYVPRVKGAYQRKLVHMYALLYPIFKKRVFCKTLCKYLKECLIYLHLKSVKDGDGLAHNISCDNFLPGPFGLSYLIDIFYDIFDLSYHLTLKNVGV